MGHVEIEEIVSEFRQSTCNISDEDVEDVLKLCRRKLEVTGQPEDYMELLLPDELKSHCFRMAVNIASLARMAGKERECAMCAS